jgi:hypothetical protein
VLFDNLFTQRQAYSSTLKFGVVMQAFKHSKDFFRVFLIEADAIVLDKDPAELGADSLHIFAIQLCADF